jgi:hypothetical protein
VEVIQVDHLEKNVKMQKSITSKQNKSVRQDGGRSWNHFASMLHEYHHSLPQQRMQLEKWALIQRITVTTFSSAV